jgi:SAM-dependent methyltransferase
MMPELSSRILWIMSWLRQISFNLLYFWNPPWDTQISPPELIEFIENHPPGRALDLGCGTGTNVITLAQHGWEATGIDYVGRAIRIARRKAQQAGVPVELQIDDVSKPKHITGSFDLILDIGCYHSLDSDKMDAYVRSLERISAHGGTYLMYGFFQAQDGSGRGMCKSDLDRFETSFDLINREDGIDRGERASVWLTYKRSPDKQR